MNSTVEYNIERVKGVKTIFFDKMAQSYYPNLFQSNLAALLPHDAENFISSFEEYERMLKKVLEDLINIKKKIR